MGDPADAFTPETDALTVVDGLEYGEYVHVYRGRFEDTPVRVFAPAPDASDAVCDAFAATADEWRRADGPGVVEVLASGTLPRPWVAVSTPGRRLPEVVSELSTDQRYRVLGDVAEALARADREGVAPVLDPSLVRVVVDGDDISAVVEWPIVHACRRAAGERVVSPYTPPERLDRPDRRDSRTAVYALGAIAVYTLTGHPPVQGEAVETAIRNGQLDAPSTLDPTLPETAVDVLTTAMAHDPAERYDSCYQCKLAFMFDTTPADSETAVTETHTASTPANEQVTSETQQDTESSDSERDEGRADGPNRLFTRRRTLLGALGVGAVGVLAGGGLFAASALRNPDVTGSSSFQYDSANTGYAPNQTGPKTNASIAWQVETGSTVSSSPAVVDGTVFVGSADTQFYALDAETGGKRWTVEADNGITSSPAVADGTVYFQTRPLGDDEATTYALDTDDGTEQWTFEAGGFVTPIPGDDAVFTGSQDAMHALDTADGTEQWTAPIPPSNLAPALADGTLYYGGTRQGERTPLVVALDTADGSERWSVEFEDADFPPFSSPAVVDGTVYAAIDGMMRAFDAADGTELWATVTRGRVAASPAVTDDSVYVHGGRNRFYAFDRANGDIRWDIPNAGQNPVSSPVVVDETIYVGMDRDITALDTADGSDRWRIQTDGEIVSSPAVFDGRLYIGGGDGNIYAVGESDAGTTGPE